RGADAGCVEHSEHTAHVTRARRNRSLVRRQRVAAVVVGARLGSVRPRGSHSTAAFGGDSGGFGAAGELRAGCATARIQATRSASTTGLGSESGADHGRVRRCTPAGDNECRSGAAGGSRDWIGQYGTHDAIEDGG